ncbi:MAG: TonB family protein [Paludibacter sp.]|nr:TonB family protein [Paludibacter sp.]
MKRIQKVTAGLKITILIILFSSEFACVSVAQSLKYDRRQEESGAKTLSPYFVVISEHPETDILPLKETSASVNIVGVIADVTVRQKYVNSGKNTLEAIYTFPLSTKAAVYAMKMTIGNRTISARISEKEKARKDYEQAKTAGNRVSLLEQNRPNVFTMNVANIAIKDTIVVELKYTELLVPENGVYSFVYPTVVGPRYSNKTKNEAGTDGKFVNTPYTQEGEAATYKFGFELKINSGIPIQDVTCTTHNMEVTHPDLNTAVVKLDKSELNGGNRDVILNYSLQGNKIESGVMLYEHGDENFFLMMVQPPKKVLLEEIPPREYIFIVDVSGSMHGYPLDISKKLLRNLIVNLKPTDKFNVVLFSGFTGILSDYSVEANQQNIERAIRLIDYQKGGGGTELMRALKRAYEIPHDSRYVSRSIVLVTDGFVDVEKEAFEMVRNNNDKSNFFAFGIGTSVNRHLIEGLAFMGTGEPMVIEKTEKADQQAEKFRNYINTPVLTQIKTDFDTLVAYDIEPGTTPDMLAERPIIIFGKYKGSHTGTVTLRGNTGGSMYEKSFDLTDIKPNPAFSAIRYLWARERIKLLDYYTNQRLYYQAPIDELLKNDITSLGLKYGLMTQYTSFIAIDEEFKIDKDGKSVTVKQPLPLTQGVSNYAVGETVAVGSGTSNQVLQGRMAGVNVTTSKGNNETRADISDVKESVTQETEEKVYQVVEQMPQFPGGESTLMSAISQNLKYPTIAQENGIQGMVIVRFLVEKDGSISRIEIVRSLDPACDKEAIRLIKLLPKFIPAKQNGVNVSVWYTLPIAFKLE